MNVPIFIYDLGESDRGWLTAITDASKVKWDPVLNTFVGDETSIAVCCPAIFIAHRLPDAFTISINVFLEQSKSVLIVVRDGGFAIPVFKSDRIYYRRAGVPYDSLRKFSHCLARFRKVFNAAVQRDEAGVPDFIAIEPALRPANCVALYVSLRAIDLDARLREPLEAWSGWRNLWESARGEALGYGVEIGSVDQARACDALALLRRVLSAGDENSAG